MSRIGIIGTDGLALDLLTVLDDTLGTHYPSLATQEREDVIVTDDPWQATAAGLKACAVDEWVATTTASDFFAITEGNGKARQALSEIVKSSAARPLAMIHPTTEVRGNKWQDMGAVIGQYSFFCDVESIGQHFMCGAFTIFGPGTRVGNFVTAGHRVVCEANVIVEDNVTIEQSAVIAAGTAGTPLRIGTGATIKAGTFVTADVPAGALVAAPRKEHES